MKCMFACPAPSVNYSVKNGQFRLSQQLLNTYPTLGMAAELQWDSLTTPISFPVPAYLPGCGLWVAAMSCLAETSLSLPDPG